MRHNVVVRHGNPQRQLMSSRCSAVYTTKVRLTAETDRFYDPETPPFYDVVVPLKQEAV
jgi:hypothetical protein